MSARTYLVVPGNRPERFAKALASGADAVVLDLENAVAAEAKSDACGAIADWAARAPAAERQRVLLRINDAESRPFADDLRLLGDLAWSRRFGFGAKLCIHPRQIDPIHAALAPSAQAVAWARRVLAADAA